MAIAKNVLDDAAGLCTSPNVCMQRPTEVLSLPGLDYSNLDLPKQNFETLKETDTSGK